MTPISAPDLAPLVLPRDPLDEAVFTGQAGPLPDLDAPAKWQPADPPWADPRPDLVGDRCRWWLLLQAAYRLDGDLPEGVFAALVRLRICGGRLEIAGPANWSLQPEGPLPDWRLVQGAELSDEEYQRFRSTYLLPHKATLTRLLSAPTAASIAHDRRQASGGGR